MNRPFNHHYIANAHKMHRLRWSYMYKVVPEKVTFRQKKKKKRI